MGLGAELAPDDAELLDVGPSHNQGDAAYQAIVGMAMPLPSVPGLSLTAEYRFMGMFGDRSYGVQVTPAVGTSMHGAVTSRADYNHSILIGLRYTFGAPPEAAPAPVFAPAADMGARTFLVFFDWDRADRRRARRAWCGRRCLYAQGNHVTRIDVDGNTDTSGLPKHNQGLSERRAQTVANELVADGCRAMPSPCMPTATRTAGADRPRGAGAAELARGYRLSLTRELRSGDGTSVARALGPAPA